MSMSGVDNLDEKSPAQLAAEERGRLALVTWCGRKRGRQAVLCRLTGIDKGAMSKMCHGEYAIGFELAVILDIATCGELRAETLCPSRAHLLDGLLRQRKAG